MPFMIIGIAVVVLFVAGFVGLYLWTRRTEELDINWERNEDGDARQGQQLGIAMNVNGTYFH